VARLVKMTAMPRSSHLQRRGRRGGSLVSITEFIGTDTKQVATYKVLEVLLGVLIGSVSFAGSAIAFIKLQELITGGRSPTRVAGHQRHRRRHHVALVFRHPGESRRRCSGPARFLLVLGHLRAPHRRGGRARAHSLLNRHRRAGRRLGFTLNQPPHRGRHPGGRLRHALTAQ